MAFPKGSQADCGLMKVYDYGSMFTNSQRYIYKLVPAVTDSQSQGDDVQTEELLQKLAGGFPSAQPQFQDMYPKMNQAKSLKRCKCPSNSDCPRQHPLDVTSLPKEDLTLAQKKTFSTTGIQGDYREIETQTYPYSRPVCYSEGTSAELLQLATLTWGQGLPAGKAEVEMIEMMRAKQAFEATLPPLNDLTQYKWKCMREEMEAKQLALRERQIREFQATGVAVLKEVLKDKNEAMKKVTKQRIKQMYLERQAIIENEKKKIQTNYEREVRKIEAKRTKVTEKLEWRVLKSDSQELAPKICQKCVSKMDTRDKFQSLDIGKDLSELKATRDTTNLDLEKRTVINIVPMPPENKALEILQTYKAMDEEEKKAKEYPRNIIRMRKQELKKAYDTKVEKPEEGEEEKDLAVIEVQKLFGEDGIQDEMEKSQKHYQGLNQETQTSYTPQNDMMQQLHKCKDVSVKKEISEEEACQAGAVGEKFHEDSLSYKLTHLQEERRIHAFMLLAERDKRLREALESGRIQEEERIRDEEDKIFKNLMQVHHESLDLFLEDIILGGPEKKADQRVREEIHMCAKEVNGVACVIQGNQDSLQSELMYNFLTPKVEITSVQQKVHKKHLLYLQAARSIIFEAEHTSGSVDDHSNSSV